MGDGWRLRSILDLRRPPVRYMLLIYGEEAPQDDAVSGDAPEISPPWMEYTSWLLREGIHTAGERLAGSSAATTVRVRDGNRLVTDGPYAETKEVLGGYYIIECDNLDEALEAAARCPGAVGGSIEVRPIIGMPVPESAG
jgi:hypothetical protein